MSITKRITRNLHIHPWYCKHADGDVVDFCRRAIELKMSMIGFSDHVPMPDGRWHSDRMGIELLDDYSDAIDEAKLLFPQLTILKGMECECATEFEPFYRDELLQKRAFDYLTGSIHYVNVAGKWIYLFAEPVDLNGLRSYVNTFIKAIESGLYTFLNHPDLLGFLYPDWDANVEASVRDMMEAAKEYGMVLEVNSKGFRRPLIDTKNGPRHHYPWRPFWEIVAEFDIPVIINTDAHRPSELIAKYDQARVLVDDLQLKIISDDELLRRLSPANRMANA